MIRSNKINYMETQMKFETKKQIRAIHKDINVNIRSYKACRKWKPNGYVIGLEELQVEIRHRHIAYCLMRGRTIEQIERNPEYPHSESLVNRFKEQYERIESPDIEVKPVEQPSNGVWSVLRRFL